MRLSRFLDYTVAAVFCLALPLLAWKLAFYFSATPLAGWDTLGHLHLARQYRFLFSSFDSLGYDPGWFQGFPVFYFYPPFFYFLIAHLDLVNGGSFESSFNLGLFLAILFFVFAYAKWSALVLDFVEPLRRFLVVALGLFVYLAYPGDGLQGTGLIGFINGTVVSTFAHGLALLSLYCLERFRREQTLARLGMYLGCAALLFYSHFLTAVFLLLLLGLYLLFHWRDFSPRLLAAIALGPIVLSWPLAVNYFGYGTYISGTAAIPDYPAVISLLGTDFLERLTAADTYVLPMLREIFIEFKWINLLLLFLFVRLLATSLRSGEAVPLRRFLLAGALGLLWLSQDPSFAHIFYYLGIHWYRVFDPGFSFFTIAAMLSLSLWLARARDVFRANLLLGGLLLIVIVRFMLWDPVAHEKYEHIQLYGHQRDATRLEAFLASLPPGSTILPEKKRGKNFYGSPHAFDYFIQKYGHKNALGLTVESSLSPLLTYAHLERGMRDIFVWGVDKTWRQKLHARATPTESLPAYLERAGVNYVLGRTPTLRAYLKQRPDRFTPVFVDRELYAFRLDRATPPATFPAEKPIGFLTYETFTAEPISHKRQVRDFLLHANQTRLRLGSGPTIINIDPTFDAATFPRQARELSGLIVFNIGPDLMPSHETHRLAEEGLPLILVNFEKTSPDPVPVRYLYTLVKLPAKYDRLQTNRARPAGRAARMESDHPHRLRVLPPPTIEEQNRTAKSVPTAADCAPLELKKSYFPHWRESRGLEIFQTDTNQMYLCVPPGETRLEFQSPLSRVLTAMMYLLVLLVAGSWLFNRFSDRKQ